MDDSDDVFIDKEMKLIEQVRLSPMLYDQSNLAFRLTHRKEHEWKLIARHVGLTADETKKRWNTIRDRFTRQLKQVKMHPDRAEIGASPFFHAMSFLKKYVKERKPRYMEYNKKRREGWTSVARPKTEKMSFFDDSNTKDDFNDDSDTQFAYAFDTSKQQSPSGGDETQFAEFVEVASSVPDDSYNNYSETPALPKAERHQSLKNEITQNTDDESIDDEPEPSPPTPPEDKYESNRMRVRSRSLMRSSLGTKSSSTFAQHTEDDHFSKTIAAYLRQLTRQHKIKAQVEIFQILEKYIDIEESSKQRRFR